MLYINIPAIAAESQVLNDPQIKAEIANSDITPDREGANPLKTPTCIPTLPKFANPHNA